MSAHFTSLKGERKKNEDKHSIILGMSNKENSGNNLGNVNYYAVYDGHGGKFVSNFLSNNIPQFFTDKSTKYPLNKTYVNEVFDGLQNVLFSKYHKESEYTGSTCLIVVHYLDNGKNYLNVINTGDSRCVMCRNGLGIPLNKDHKPNWPDERTRITQLGGVIKQDDYGDYRIDDISVSRAFGDKISKKFITHRPDLYRYKITNQDKFIVLGCDGLWDVLTCQDVVNFVLENCYDMKLENRINKEINISRRLAEHAINSGSTDNVTVIVVFFD